MGARLQVAAFVCIAACSSAPQKAEPAPTVAEDAQCAKLASAQSLQAEGYLYAALAALDAGDEGCDAHEVLRERARVLGDLGLAGDAIQAWRAYAVGAASGEMREAELAIAELEARPSPGAEVAGDVADKAIILYRDGVNLRLSGDHTTAITQLRRSYALAPHALTIVQIAVAHASAGNDVEARKATARALAIAEATQGVSAEPVLPVLGRDWISQVAMHPSGRIAAVAHTDGMIRTFDVSTRTPIAAWKVERSPVIAIDPDGRVITVGDSQGNLSSFDLATGDAIAELPKQGERVKLVAYSPDGSILAAATNGAVSLLDVASGQLRLTIEPIPAAGARVAVMAIAFSPDGATIAAADYGGPVRAWDVTTGTLRWRANGGETARSLAFSPDGSTVVAGLDPVRAWRAADGVAVSGYESIAADHVAFAGSGRLLADGELWEVPSGSRIATLQDDPLGVHTMAVASDGTALVTSARGPVAVLDVVGARVLGRLGAVAEPVSQVAAAFDGTAWAVARREGHISLWSREAGGRASTERRHDSWADGVAVSDKGERIASVGADGTIVVADANGLVIQSIRVEAPATSVALSPDGTLMATGAKDNTVTLWRVDSGEVVHRYEGHTDEVKAVAFDRTATALYSASFDGTVGAWDVQSGQALLSYTDIGDWVLSLAVTADGSYVIGGGSDGRILVWNAATGDVVREMVAEATVEVLALLPGNRLLSSSAPGTLEVWDLDTGERTERAMISSRVSSLAQLDRTHVLVGSPNGWLSIWDVDKNEVSVEILEVADGAWVAVAPDGRVDGSDDGHRFLTWRVGDLVLPGFVGWQRQRTPGLVGEL